MRRNVRALAALSLLALGCQDYNFNPVGHCLIQPGTRRVKLADVSTADILFVVDDSGSMSDVQNNLAGGFSSFMTNLNGENADRVSRGLEPIDFHIAITTTALFIDRATGGVCKATCGTSTNVCCSGTSTVVTSDERTCSGPGGTCGAGYTCSNTCAHAPGGYVCCSGAGDPERLPVTCTAQEVTDAVVCGRVDTRYPSACGTWGVGSAYAKWPHGDFVRLGANPKVLHFDKKLYLPDGGGTNESGQTEAQLRTFFTENVKVGICGSGQEQGLQAGKLAVQKALDGLQPGVAAGEWPHPQSKLLVVWVGDEDDCSSPEDPIDGIILTGTPGDDSCTTDPQGRLFSVSSMADYLTGLGRSTAAGFIVATSDPVCQDLVSTDTTNACVPGTYCTPVGSGAPGRRFLEMAHDLQDRGTEIVAGSICAPNPDYFGPVLSRIADIVKPPSVLTLPTPPAAGEVTVVRIVDKAGLTRKTCNGPGSATPDWWFTSAVNTRDPVELSQYVFIDHSTNNCEANPGQTYSADYLGRLPAEGCTTPADCTVLGGDAASWQCIVPVVGQPGTCVCGS
jgi:hypothetical protein